MTPARDLIPAEYAARLAGFPPELRALLEAELAAGNEIAEVASCFPAPPAGVYVKLARPVTTRPRADGGGVSFYDRNGSTYSGEFHDARRFHFVLEPPRPPEPEPDMDAIRAALTARAAVHGSRLGPTSPGESPSSAASPAPRSGPAAGPADGRDEPDIVHVPNVAPRSDRAAAPPTSAEDGAVRRFERSMVIDYEKWHDGIGYDLDVLCAATPDERKQIEDLLVARGASDWRDVEALASLGTPRAQAALRTASRTGSREIRLAVVSHAPELVPDAERTALLVAALGTDVLFGGLSQALDEVAEFHPPEVIDALFRGALGRSGDVAVHFAAMLTFLHGKAAEPFDWNQRPFFLRFHTEDRAEREAAFRDLCARIGADPAKLLGS